MAAQQKALRDYIFTVAAGEDAGEYLADGRVALLGPLAGKARRAALRQVKEGLNPSEVAGLDLEVLRYDGDLVQVQLHGAAGDGQTIYWAPKEPLAKAVPP